MLISIKANQEKNQYALCELERFLTEYTGTEVVRNGEAADKVITLTVDSSLKEYRYRVCGDGTVLHIAGGSSSALLCGVYDALAEAGIFFQATGYSVPKVFDLDAMFRVNKDVSPKFRQRGIRQHINFPMDVSCYSLKEAKEYIRSLARMRYNAIAFHSYPGQWHEQNPDDPSAFAGHFFYGQVYPVPTDDPITADRVENRKYHCIPEAENIYEDKAARGAYAKYWLNELMRTAKEACMEVTLSVEILKSEEPVMIRMLQNVCRTYPLIDTLELITEENGAEWELPSMTMDNVIGYMTDMFGSDILDSEGHLPGLLDFIPRQLACCSTSLSRVLQAMECRDTWLQGLPRIPKLRAGLYITCADTLRVLLPILRKHLPEGCTMSYLPAHGSLAVADNIEKSGVSEEDWQNTMFYSWAEFDGNMFLQQLSTDGIEKLVSMQPAESVYGFCLNHWRTAENNLTISYAAEAAISMMPLTTYYRKYAEALGIADKDLFADTCTKMATLDTYNRDNLFNIGFCAVLCWYNWCRRGTAIIPRSYPVEYECSSMAQYETVIENWKKVLPTATTKEGIALLRLMINRCQTSVLHIQALMTLNRITEIYDYNDPKPLTAEQAKTIHDIIDSAMAYAMQYLHVYGELLPDRGGEGHLISYYETTVAFIRAVAANFKNASVDLHDDVYDAPPMPDADVK